MPYIPKNEREKLDAKIESLSSGIESVGQLNYCITRLVLRLLDRLGKNYGNISNVMGTLSLIPLEIHRRCIVWYENGKIKENGDLDEYIDF